MASELYVETLKGLTSGANANTVTVGSGQTLYAPGHVIQVVQTYKTDAFSMTTATTETDITGLSVTITPSSASSKVLVTCTVHWSADASQNSVILLKRGSTTIGSGTSGSVKNGFSMANQGVTDNRLVMPSNIMYLDSPSTTSATTYKIAAWTDNSVLLGVNRRATNTEYGMSSHITAMEIAG